MIVDVNKELVRMGVIRPEFKKSKVKGHLSVSFKGRSYLNYKEARSKVRLLNLRSPHEWKRHCYIHDLPRGVPTDPDVVYRRNGWENYRDWLGVKVIKIVKRKKRRRKLQKTAKKAKVIFLKKELNTLKYGHFKRLISNRIPRAVKAIKLIGNLSNRSSYSYTEEEYKKVFVDINKSINQLKKSYKK